MAQDWILKHCIVCGKNRDEEGTQGRMYFVDETRTAVRCRTHAQEDIRDDHPWELAYRQRDVDAAVAAERVNVAVQLLAVLTETDKAYGTSWVEAVQERCDDFDWGAIRARGGKPGDE